MHPFAAMKALLSLVGIVAVAAMVSACGQKRTQPVTTSMPVQPSASVGDVPLPVDEPSADREKRPRFGQAAVYIDGKPAGMLRATELPKGLKARTVSIGGGHTASRYGLLDYVRALGVESKRIKALHLYGGSRVVVVDRAEVGRIGDRIMFSFSQGERGKTRVHWPPVKLNVNTTIDMASHVVVYVDKVPPVLDAQGELVMPDGSPVDGKIPYAPQEQGNGTRVYVDGVLVGTVKRKKLTDEMRVTSPTSAKTDAESTKEERFALLSYAAKLRPAAKLAKGMDLVAGDDVVARISGDQARSVTFNVPPRNRGQAVVDVPSIAGPSQRARISAVQIYVTGEPPVRSVVPIDEAPEASVRSDQGGRGSDEEL